MFDQPLRRWLAISCLALVTTACGGGGGGSGGSNSGSGSTTNAPSTAPSGSPAPGNLNRSVRLSWTVPTTRVDGSPLPTGDISAYRLFYTRDGSAAAEDQIVYIGNGSMTNTNVSLATAGTYTFAITAVDREGVESPLSPPVSISVN